MYEIRRNEWKIGILVVGILAFLFLVGTVSSTRVNAQAGIVGLATPKVSTVQQTPTVDATVTALNKQKLVEDVEQQQHTLGNWWWGNAATFLSSLALGIAGAFTLVRYLRDQRNEREKLREERQKQREEHQTELEKRAEEQQRWLKNQEGELEKRAEERFQSAVVGLGDEKEGAQIGAAILLRTFLRPGYEQFYVQTFDLAVANLRRRRVSNLVQYQLWDAPQNPDITLPLTTLDQALIVVFKEAFPQARDQEKRETAYLDATGVQLDNAYLVGANLTCMWAPRASLQRANLTDADLSNANLKSADLTGAIFVDAKLINTNLSFAKISNAYFRVAKLISAKLICANLTETDFSEADFGGADLTGVNLTNAILSNANLGNADLTNANLNRAYFGEANLTNANLFRTDLRKAILNRAILTGANLSVANLSGANLTDADLTGTNLSNAVLTGVNLSGANLTDADLTDANLSNADLFSANLTGVDLNKIKGLTKEQLVDCQVRNTLVDKKSSSSVFVSASPSQEPQDMQSSSTHEHTSTSDANYNKEPRKSREK